MMSQATPESIPSTTSASKQAIAYLVLEDGTVLKGKAFGATRPTAGEVVFNTAMTGYQEILTDPSYCGQIVTMTYPLMGNYGINREDFETINPSVEAMIVKEHSVYPQNWRSEKTLDRFLKELDIPGLSAIDTRMLTRKIRKYGTVKGRIISQEMLKNEYGGDESLAVESVRQISLPRDQVRQVSTRNAFHAPGDGYHVVLVDFGAKTGILKELTARGCDVRVVPYDTTAEEILRLSPDGVMLSNGPGDPQDVPQGVEMIKGILGKIPVFGICLGHQLLSLACGATTHKLKFGHRGANHPVLDLETGQTTMTSQNHGYTVGTDSLAGTRLKMTHQAINDKTVEGVRHLDAPAFSVQYHPEARPGPYDSNPLFDRFMDMMKSHTGAPAK
jgi:carbamoyl-phosphate synthase small subunit